LIVDVVHGSVAWELTGNQATLVASMYRTGNVWEPLLRPHTFADALALVAPGTLPATDAGLDPLSPSAAPASVRELMLAVTFAATILIARRRLIRSSS
jgi:hypothetical protein